MKHYYHLNKVDLFYLYEFREFMKRKGALKEWKQEFINSKSHGISTILGISPDKFNHLTLFDIGHYIKARAYYIEYRSLESSSSTFIWSYSKKGYKFWLDIFKQFKEHLSVVNADKERIDILYAIYSIYDKKYLHDIYNKK